jgi:hypothetical protein
MANVLFPTMAIIYRNERQSSDYQVLVAPEHLGRF